MLSIKCYNTLILHLFNIMVFLTLLSPYCFLKISLQISLPTLITLKSRHLSKIVKSISRKSYFQFFIPFSVLCMCALFLEWNIEKIIICIYFHSSNSFDLILNRMFLKSTFLFIYFFWSISSLLYAFALLLFVNINHFSDWFHISAYDYKMPLAKMTTLVAYWPGTRWSKAQDWHFTLNKSCLLKCQQQIGFAEIDKRK